MLKHVLGVILSYFLFPPVFAQQSSSAPPGIVIDKSDDPRHVFFGSPSIAILPGGNYAASHNYFGGGSGNDSTAVFISEDKGKAGKEVQDCMANIGQHYLSIKNNYIFWATVRNMVI